MSQAPSMPVFTDALIGDTLHLTNDEFGSYCLLLFATWRNNGKALPDDPAELAQICRVTPQRWRGHMRQKLSRFFNISDGHWHQKRLEKEWCAVQAKMEVNRANGSKGGRPRSGSTVPPKPTGNPPVISGETETEPVTNPEEKSNESQTKAPISHKPNKLASNGSRELPSAWAERAAAERAATGLPEADLPAEWAKFLAKIDDEPTLDRWLGWALKARIAGSNGRTKPGDLLPEPPWPQRCRGWAKGHRWNPDHGPAPDEPGCWAPADLIAKAIAERSARHEPRPA